MWGWLCELRCTQKMEFKQRISENLENMSGNSGFQKCTGKANRTGREQLICLQYNNYKDHFVPFRSQFFAKNSRKISFLCGFKLMLHLRVGVCLLFVAFWTF